MLSSAAQLSFAAELIAMLVAASGLVLVAGRRQLTPGRAFGRPVLAVAFAVLAGVAFAHGALLVGADSTRESALRLGGGLLLAAGASGRTGGRRVRGGLIVGGGLNAASAVTVLGGGSSVATSVVLVVANVAVAFALAATGARSIAARVAANAAAALLLVVVVLSVALSSVITSSVEHQQLAAVQSGSAAQAADVVTLSDRALGAASLVAAGLEGYFSRPGLPTLPQAAVGAAAGRPADRRRISVPLQTMASFDTGASFAFLNGRTTIAGARAIPKGTAATAAVRGLSCVPGRAGSDGHAAVVATAGGAAAVGAYAVCVTGPVRQVGTILAVTSINATYLAGIRSTAPSAALAVVGRGGVIAAVGARPSRELVDVMRRRISAGSGAVARIAGGRFVAGIRVGASSSTAATGSSVWLIASSSTAPLASTRNSLMRTLFIIALGGTLLALVLAVATGDRITAGLRRLTRMVTDVGEGGSPPRLSEADRGWGPGGSSGRVGIAGHDEVGVLATAFEAMVGAVDEKNAALRRAADDETRLRNRLEAVVAGMGDGLVAVDGRGRITDFNRAAERLTATSATSAVGALARDVIVLSGEGAAGLRRHFQLLDPTPWSGLADLTRSDGVVVPLAVSAGAVRGPVGEELGTVLVLRDLRKEQEVERMKTEFLSRVGHELRTPLTGILGYAELLVRRNVPADVAGAWLAEILAAAKRELRIVRLLEFFAAWGAGRNTARFEPVDIGAFVRAVTVGWAERLPAGDRISCQVEAGLPVVQVDREWLELALDEIVDNAVKYSPAGVAIEVNVRSDEESAVEIDVVDEGMGMTPEETARVFGAFEQADPSDTRRFGGLGLGLAAVGQIVADHGGRVRCRSVPGQGTTLSLWLPVVIPAGSVPTNAGE